MTKPAIASSIGVLAVGPFAADQNLLNLVLALVGVIGAVVAFQKWVDGRIDLKLRSQTDTIVLKLELEISKLRGDLGLKQKSFANLIAEKKERGDL